MILRLSFLAAAPRVRRFTMPLGCQWLAVFAGMPALPWRRRVWQALVVAPCVLLLTSCPTMQSHRGQPGLGMRVEVPAAIVANFFLVEATIEGRGPYRLLVDTGSTLSLISPEAAEQAMLARGDDSDQGVVEVHSSRGDSVQLPRITLGELGLGGAHFKQVPAALYDFSAVSAQLGVKIDGLIGFSVFRDVLVTLDYPGRRLVIADASALQSGDHWLAFDVKDGRPLAAIEVGGDLVLALIDSGSDGAMSLNPDTAPRRFVGGVRAGTLNATISGDFPQVLGRLAEDVHIGGHAIAQPIVELTPGPSSVGGELLQHFALTFDQQRGLIGLQRSPEAAPIAVAPRRSAGVVFDRQPAAWKVAAIVPHTPVEALPISLGDECVRVNGEPTAAWPIERYQELIRASDAVTFTLISAAGEREVRVPVVALVP